MSRTSPHGELRAGLPTELLGPQVEKSWSGKLAFNAAIRSTRSRRVAGCAKAPSGEDASIDDGEF